MGKPRKLPRETTKMQKTPVAQAFLTILTSKNNWENDSREMGKPAKVMGKSFNIFDSRFELHSLC